MKKKKRKKKYPPVWTKEQVIARLQLMLNNIEPAIAAEFTFWAKLLDFWCKLTNNYHSGFDKPTKNIILIPYEESKELWEERLKIEQAEAFAKAESKMAGIAGATDSSN